MSPSKKNNRDLSFEEAYKKLEQIADRLESGEVPLEASMKVFEEGMMLVKLCTDKLDSAEAQLKKLVKGEEGFQMELMGSDE